MDKAIVYLHGFRSSPASTKAALIVRAVHSLPPGEQPALHVPALDAAPDVAIATTDAWIRAHVAHPDRELTIIGSSLGGYYATHLAERHGARAVLVNPAVHPARDLAPYLGWQTNLYTGERFLVTEAHFEALAALAVERITSPERYWLIVQAGDEVLDYREAVAFYAGAHQLVEGDGDHAFVGFERHVPAILRFAGVPLSGEEMRA